MKDLKALNKIRNKYAHNLDYTITKKDAMSFNFEKEDDEAWHKDKILFITGKAAHLAGYLTVAISGGNKLRPIQYTADILEEIVN